MKYNVYKSEMENATTFWYFPSEQHEEVIANDFIMVSSANTAKEARKIVNELYN